MHLAADTTDHGLSVTVEWSSPPPGFVGLPSALPFALTPPLGYIFVPAGAEPVIRWGVCHGYVITDAPRMTAVDVAAQVQRDREAIRGVYPKLDVEVIEKMVRHLTARAWEAPTPDTAEPGSDAFMVRRAADVVRAAVDGGEMATDAARLALGYLMRYHRDGATGALPTRSQAA